MKRINITVNDKRPEITAISGVAVTDNDYLLQFEFDDEWGEGIKTVYVVDFNGNYTTYLMDDNSINVKFENTRYVDIGVSCGALITSMPCRIAVNPSIKCKLSTEIPPPAPDVYAQILQKLNQLETGVVPPEEIRAAVDEYLSENPVQAYNIGYGLTLNPDDNTLSAEVGDLSFTEIENTKVQEIFNKTMGV